MLDLSIFINECIEINPIINDVYKNKQKQEFKTAKDSSKGCLIRKIFYFITRQFFFKIMIHIYGWKKAGAIRIDFYCRPSCQHHQLGLTNGIFKERARHEGDSTRNYGARNCGSVQSCKKYCFVCEMYAKIIQKGLRKRKMPVFLYTSLNAA